MPTCGSCGAEILWAKTPTGAMMPCDVERETVPAPRMVARNPARGTCVVLAEADVANAAAWVAAGAELHRSHWESCPSSRSHRGEPQAEHLPGL